MTHQHRSARGPDGVLVSGAEALGIRLNPGQVGAFRAYREEILRWSGRMNLTGLRDPEEIVRAGFLDSLACLSLIPPMPNASSISAPAQAFRRCR
jgi:16S rRNA G527 N7-methylase RsmG